MPLDDGDYPYIDKIGDTLRWLPDALRWAENDLQMAKMLLAIIAPESHGNPEAVGDNGKSHGLFQIYDIHNISVADRQDPEKAFRWRMTHPEGGEQVNITQHLENYLAQGFEYGSQLASELGGKVQVSNPAFHHRYGEAWDVIDSALGGAQTGDAALAALKGARRDVASGASVKFPLEGVVAISPGQKGEQTLGEVYSGTGHDRKYGWRPGRYIRGIPLPPRRGPTGAGQGYD